MKLALSAALALAVVALALLFWRERPSAVPIEPAPSPQEDVAALGPTPEAVVRPAPPSVVPLSGEELPRQAVPLPEVAAEAKSLPATVRLRLVSKDDGTPIAGERLALHDQRNKRWSATHVEGSRAAPGQSPVTDSEGRAEFEVEAGVPLTVHILSRGSPEGSEIPALAEGEQRDVTIEIPTLPDIRLHGRLVDADSGLPVSGGLVRVEANSWSGTSRAADEIPARSDGTFEIEARSWEVRFASARGDEHARVIFGLEPGHETTERALEVRLSRAATLEVLVLDGISPRANATVELTTHAFYLLQNTDGWMSVGEDPAWTADSDASGIATLADLPPRVPLRLAVQPRDRPRRVEAEPITLEPGQQTRIEVHLDSGSAIIGRVEDEQGRPVAQLPIWRLAAEYPGRKRIESYDEPAARTRTDDEGRFRFEDVPQGAWHVGPPSISGWEESARTADAIAGLAELVQVEPGSDPPEVVILVDRGLYLSGTVLDPDGSPAPEIWVSAHSERDWNFPSILTDEAGRFRIGPLAAGSYAVQAGSLGLGLHAPSETRIARAGDAELVLHLRVGGAIRGRTVDAAGRPQKCEVMLAQEGEDGWIGTESEGTFSFGGLLPGVYVLNARSSGGLCGRRSGLILRAGATLEGKDVVLEPGARLHVTFDGQAPYGYFEIRVEGHPFLADGLERGTKRTVFVLAGEIEVRWRGLDGAQLKSQRLTLAPGDERSITWDGKE